MESEEFKEKLLEIESFVVDSGIEVMFSWLLILKTDDLGEVVAVKLFRLEEGGDRGPWRTPVFLSTDDVDDELFGGLNGLSGSSFDSGLFGCEFKDVGFGDFNAKSLTYLSAIRK